MNYSLPSSSSRLRSFSRHAKVYKPEELKGDAQVVPEVEVLLHVDHVVEAVFVFPLNHVQDFQLHQSLVVEPANRHSDIRSSVIFVKKTEKKKNLIKHLTLSSLTFQTTVNFTVFCSIFNLVFAQTLSVSGMYVLNVFFMNDIYI